MEKIKEILNNLKEADYWNNANLHIHTNVSDGKSSVDTVVSYCKGLKYFSITDHNSIEAYDNEQLKICDNVIYGVEFDCWHKGVFIHILGYGMDINNPDFQKLLAKNQKSKTDSLTRILEGRNTVEVIKTIKKAGGVAILAHPACYWCISLDYFVKDLIKAGLDGMEVYYPYKRHRKIIKFHFQSTVKKVAQKYNLIMTGGTDEHRDLNNL